MSWVKHAGGGSSHGMPELPEIRIYEGPAFTDPSQVGRARYRSEPYVQVELPERVQDAKARAWTSSHVLISWPDENLTRHQAWVPARWVRRIAREESSWRDPYDKTD